LEAFFVGRLHRHKETAGKCPQPDASRKFLVSFSYPRRLISQNRFRRWGQDIAT
jgi:hypothetical protein